MIKIKIPSYCQKLIDSLNNCGFEGFLVGGCVRDALLGEKPNDYDITTNATPDEMLKVFKDYTVIKTGLKHGTLTVVVEGKNIEVTTFRVDGEYSDNRRPDSVEFTKNIEDDLSRRDFTVNAMAYNDQNGFVDVFGGMKDLENKIIKCVGNPDKRFLEDGLRILRAIRFASVLDFEIEEETAKS